MKIVKGNMLEDGNCIIVNPVNTLGVMGGGLAAAIYKKYPEACKKYKGICKRYGTPEQSFCPGHILTETTNDGTVVIHLATKDHFRDPSKYSYVVSGLQKLSLFIEHKKYTDSTTIGVPALGCGLGGLKFSHVLPCIKHHLGNSPCDIKVYEPQ